MAPAKPSSGTPVGDSKLLQGIKEILEDKAAEERLAKLAGLVRDLGHGDFAEEVLGLINRERNEVRGALMVLQKAEATGDVIGPELASSKLLATIGAEQILHATLARFVVETLFLEDSDVERQAKIDIIAPAHLMNLVKLLKSEIKNRSGRHVPDSQVFISAVLYAVVNLEDFLRQSLAVSAPVAAENRAVTRHRASSGGKP